MVDKKKQADLSALLQGLSLRQLKEDFENLQPYLEQLDDKALNNQIKRLINELDSFNKTLQKKKEYSPQQVEELAAHIDSFASALNERIESLKTEVMERFEKHVGEQFKQIGLFAFYTIEKDKQKVNAFMDNLKAAQFHLHNASKNMKHLAEKSPGYEHSSIEKLSHACHRARKSIVSFYKTTIDILTHGINASVFKTLKSKLPWAKPAPVDETKPHIFKRKNR